MSYKQLKENNELNTNETKVENLKKKILIDFSKLQFTDNENHIIKKEVSLIKEKYPTYIPILIRSDKLKFTQYKYLVNEDVTVSQFMMIIKKKVELRPYEALYLFINNVIPQGSILLKNLYNNEKDFSTDMLIIMVCKENTFG